MNRRGFLGIFAASLGLIGYAWITSDKVEEWDQCPECDQVADTRFSVSRSGGTPTYNSWETTVTITFFEEFTGYARVRTLDGDGKVLETKTVPVEQQTSVDIQFVGEETKDVSVEIGEV